MDQYRVTLTGLTPLIMHHDNLAFTEKIEQWRKDPANKELSSRGDDRSPAWTWVGYAYHDSKHLGIPSDNLMTMLREGGAKVAKKGKETFKKQTQAGVLIDKQQFDLFVNGALVPVQPLRDLIGNNDFNAHLDVAEQHGFELLVKRAKIGQSKHIRVRPMFREWLAEGTITIPDSETTGLKQHVLESILNQAGVLVGIGDWRPSSGQSGSFGKFEAALEKIG